MNPEDLNRKKMLSMTLTVGSATLLLGLFITRLYSYFSTEGDVHIGVSLYLIPCLLICHAILFALIRKNKILVVSFALTVLYTVGTVYGAYKWGVSMPTALLLFSLVIGLIGVLFSSKKALIATIFAFIIIFLLGLREIKNPDITSWKNYKVDIIDICSYIVIIGISSGLTLLSNREIEKSLKRARESEKDLEQKVENRTKELKKSQLETITAMSQMYELGKVAQGLFHDLITPLSSAALYISEYDRTNTKQYIDKAVIASHRMGKMLDITKRQIKISTLSEEIDVANEINSVIELLQFSARKKEVKIKTHVINNFSLIGVPIKVNQIISNIIQNAIECFTGNNNNIIDILVENKSIAIINNGPKIPENILDSLFKKSITTKSNHFGIGLPNIKNIIEDCFNGTITVISNEKSTTFKLTFPNAKEHIPISTIIQNHHV